MLEIIKDYPKYGRDRPRIFPKQNPLYVKFHSDQSHVFSGPYAKFFENYAMNRIKDISESIKAYKERLKQDQIFTL